MLLNLGLNIDKCIHTLPLRSVPFHISPSLSLPLQTLRLVSLISLIAKTKRIAEWVLAARARPCATRIRLFGLIATTNGALRAFPPIAASLLP